MLCAANVPGKLPKKLHRSAKERLRDIYAAPSGKHAQKALVTSEDLFGCANEKAVTCLCIDQEELLSFYQFPLSTARTFGARIQLSPRLQAQGNVRGNPVDAAAGRRR